jgi:hypothetical protein
VSLDDLELELRRMPGVLSVGFAETEGLVVVELQAGPDAADDLARTATMLAINHLGNPTAVEVVRWGDGPPGPSEARLRLVEVTTDPAAGELSVHLARDEERAIGRAASSHGLLGVVEATVYAVRTFLPNLTYLPGWARMIETTPERRFIVVASVTDPDARSHLRGAAEGETPLEAAARATLATLNRTISRELAT